MQNLDNVLSEAKRLYDKGFAILLIHPRDKRPKGMAWTKGERSSWDEILKSYEPGDNIGVRTGEPSKIGENYLACIDVDIKNPAYEDRAKRVVSKLIGNSTCPEVISGSGTGSRHFYCVTSQPFKMITVDKCVDGEVCVYSNGRQMVLPPSIHPSGKRYLWVTDPNKKTPFPLIEFSTPETRDVDKKSRIVKNSNPLDGEFSFTPCVVDLEWLTISKEMIDLIKSGTGVDDRSAFLLKATKALVSAGLNQDETLSILTDKKYFISQPARERRGNNRTSQAQWLWEYTVKKIFEERNPVNVFGPASEVKEKRLNPDEVLHQTEEILEGKDWEADLDRNQIGHVKPTLKNLNLILTHTFEGKLFKKDLFSNQIIYGVDAPWGTKKGKPVQDVDALLIKHWLGTGDFRVEPKKENIFEAIELMGHKNQFHPIRDWLVSLKWDGKPRINTWLKNYCEARGEDAYISQVSRKFLLAMVKRVFMPGCQCDYVLILEGAQGKYKSSIARAIAGDRWFLDNLPDLRDKDAMLSLQGKWLIELGELTNVKRSDFNLVKQYLVRRIDTVRPHYGRTTTELARQSVFIGTVNDGQYLKDPTGNRRFWPVAVGECNVKGLLKVRDQLFAEAYAFYDKEELMLTGEAIQQASDAQNERRVEDDFSQMEDAFIEWKESLDGQKFDWSEFSLKSMFIGGPWFSFDQRKGYVAHTAASILRKHGFKNGLDKKRSKRVWKKMDIRVDARDVGKVDLMVSGRRQGRQGDTEKREVVSSRFSEENFY